jgi:hypothetical protein
MGGEGVSCGACCAGRSRGCGYTQDGETGAPKRVSRGSDGNLGAMEGRSRGVQGRAHSAQVEAITETSGRAVDEARGSDGLDREARVCVLQAARAPCACVPVRFSERSPASVRRRWNVCQAACSHPFPMPAGVRGASQGKPYVRQHRGHGDLLHGPPASQTLLGSADGTPGLRGVTVCGLTSPDLLECESAPLDNSQGFDEVSLGVVCGQDVHGRVGSGGHGGEGE